MKKINPIKKWYYDSIREIEIKSGETMSAAARKRFLVCCIICALIIGYIVLVWFIQPIGMHILGIEPEVPPVSVHLMKNHSLSNIKLLEYNEKTEDKIQRKRYKPDDSMYYILSIDEEKCKEVTVYVDEFYGKSGKMELKHLVDNQYHFEFVKSRFTVKYRIFIEKHDGEIESYSWAYDSW